MIGPLPGTFTDKKLKIIWDVIYTNFSHNENIVLHIPCIRSGCNIDVVLNYNT